MILNRKSPKVHQWAKRLDEYCLDETDTDRYWALVAVGLPAAHAFQITIKGTMG